jgi:type I restriction enzyme S subunit
MSVESLITQHLDIWTSAIKTKSAAGRGSSKKLELVGVKKLRELILELAVRGKLVPQDANDEPASELLKKIEAEKARLVKEGKIKKQKPLPPIVDDDKSFELPKNWTWCRLEQTAYSQAGFAFKSKDFNESNLGLPLIRIRDVGQPFSGTYFSGEYKDEFVVKTGDYLISMDGNFRVAPWESNDALLNQRVSRLIFYSNELAARFIAESLQIRLVKLQGVKAYTTVDHLSGGQISSSVIALPPLNEQHLIIAKVDELMALCDRLEAQTESSIDAHKTLVEVLLATLTDAKDADELNDNWQTITQHFDVLFTTQASIDQLKQTILQLAVMGKLVKQDPKDEPASKLLERIATEKQQLIKDGKIKKQKPVEPIGELIYVPSSWQEIVIQDFADVKLGSTPSRAEPKYWNGNIPWVSSGEVANEVIRDTKEKITDEGFKNSSTSIIPPRSLLMAIIGQGKTRGQTALLEVGACTNQNVAAFVFNETLVVPEFVWLWAKSKYEAHRSDGRGGAQPALNGKIVRSFRFPLPPFKEQCCIVAKVDELMVLCDSLKIQLSQVQTTQLNLTDAIVGQTL